MAKISVDNVGFGTALSAPVINDAGVTLVPAGAVVTPELKEKLHAMGITEVSVLIKATPEMPKEEFVAKVNASFSKAETDARMARMKKALLAHVEDLYAC